MHWLARHFVEYLSQHDVLGSCLSRFGSQRWRLGYIGCAACILTTGVIKLGGGFGDSGMFMAVDLPKGG